MDVITTFNGYLENNKCKGAWGGVHSDKFWIHRRLTEIRKKIRCFCAVIDSLQYGSSMPFYITYYVILVGIYTFILHYCMLRHVFNANSHVLHTEYRYRESIICTLSTALKNFNLCQD